MSTLGYIMWACISFYYTCKYILTGSTDPFWIGLYNLTWVTGETFDNVYGLDPETIRLPTTGVNIQCRRVRFRLQSRNTITGVQCASTKPFVCELYIQN